MNIVRALQVGSVSIGKYHEHDPRKFYPSEASVEAVIDGEKFIFGGCLRAQWYRWFGYHDELAESNPDYAIAALQGDALHNFIVRLLTRTTAYHDILVLDAEVPFVDEELNVSGRVDAILKHVDTGEKAGLEIKTVGEYKTREALDSPIMSHVLQALYYLYYYNVKKKRGFKEWILLYFSRADGYMTKGKKHGSPLAQAWQYSIRMLPNGTEIVGAKGRAVLTWLHAADIPKRWRALREFIRTKTLPPRDFEASYSEEKIVGMYKNGKLPFKYQKEAVKKWLANGAPEGKLDLDMGASQCKFCPAKNLCARNAVPKERAPKQDNWEL